MKNIFKLFLIFIIVTCIAFMSVGCGSGSDEKNNNNDDDGWTDFY